jgi:hypothetical protein
MSVADPYFSAKRAPQPEFRIVGASGTVFENPYRMFSKSISSNNIDNIKISGAYPRYISVGSIVVIIGTIASGLIGYFLPGPITGALLPVFVTLWWILYRAISRFDNKQNA